MKQSDGPESHVLDVGLRRVDRQRRRRLARISRFPLPFSTLRDDEIVTALGDFAQTVEHGTRARRDKAGQQRRR